MARPPDLDLPLLPGLAAVPLELVFVVGLHRSGTTFLYETLARHLPLAPLTADGILRYGRLLHDEAAGRTAAARAALDAGLARRGLATREIDEVALSHATCEEYGFLLAARAGELRLTEATAPLLAECSRKLRVLDPAARAVLHKNPWDTGHAARALALFPGSRFVFIRRDPARILNSQLKAALHNGARHNGYLQLLIREFPAGRRIIRWQRALYRLTGRALYTRIVLRLLQRDIARELRGYARSRAALPPGTFVELAYEDLCERPAAELERVAAFLGLEPTRPLSEVAARPRGGRLHPLVAAAAPAFVARLERDASAARA